MPADSSDPSVQSIQQLSFFTHDLDFKKVDYTLLTTIKDKLTAAAKAAGLTDEFTDDGSFVPLSDCESYIDAEHHQRACRMMGKKLDVDGVVHSLIRDGSSQKCKIEREAFGKRFIEGVFGVCCLEVDQS